MTYKRLTLEVTPDVRFSDPDAGSITERSEKYHFSVKVPLRRKFVGLFRPNSVAEYRVVSIFTQKTKQETVHPNIF